jgi:ribosomal protein L30/L7E
MDARSFLDRSADIAAAVRYAMLNLNSINDVVSDL